MRDNANVVLGRLVQIGTYLNAINGAGLDTIWILTSTKYLVPINYDGKIATAQINWSAAGCTGQPYLNSGTSDPKRMYGKIVMRSINNQLYAPTDLVNGVATSVALPGAVSIENPTCTNGSGPGGWHLQSVTMAALGLPATIAGPLQLP